MWPMGTCQLACRNKLSENLYARKSAFHDLWFAIVYELPHGGQCHSPIQQACGENALLIEGGKLAPQTAKAKIQF